jgi:hypothetical protein
MTGAAAMDAEAPGVAMYVTSAMSVAITVVVIIMAIYH